MSSRRQTARALVERFGGHPAAPLGLDLAEDAAVGRWFVLACLLGGRVAEERALRAWRALDAAGGSAPAALAAADPADVAEALQAASYPRAAPTAHRLKRAGAALVTGHGGSFDSLAAGCDGLEELGSRLARLAPGVGAATVLRFLRPLREAWMAAREVPLDPAARAAAVHLDWLPEGADLEGEPGALRAAIAEESDAPPPLADVEAALGRLGRLACLRSRADRCPLGNDCPLARSDGPLAE